MTNNLLDSLPSMTTEELWNLYVMAKEDGTISDEEYENVKQGIGIMFDIRQYIRYNKDITTSIRINAKANTALIGRLKFSLTAFDDEMDKRKGIMRKTLLKYLQTEETLSPRT